MGAVEILATYAGGGSGAGTTIWEPGVEMQDGDALLWFYRADSAGLAPSGRMASLCDNVGVAITFDYEPHRDWGALDSTHYVTLMDGDHTFDGGGSTIVSDYIYVIFDQFTGFDAGNHSVKFTLPGVARAHIEAAHLLRGVTPTAPGAYIFNTEPTPDYRLTYAPGGSVVLNAFPVSVPLTGNSSIIYCLYAMTGSIVAVNPTAGYVSVAGTTIKNYTYTDPTASPTTMTQGKIAYIAGLSGVSGTVAQPTTNGTAGGGSNTTYTMDVIVINGTEAPLPPVPPTVYFVDLIVFNGSASAAPVEF
jgi:hypothetical protein